MNQTLILHEPVQAHKALTAILWPLIKSWLICNGSRLVLTVKLEKRTDPQNRQFHALCGNIAAAKVQWLGKPRTTAQWKVLLVSGHAVATGEGSEVIAGLEGEFINLRESTALMSKKRGASLIEYTLAFCAHHSVPLPAVEYGEYA